MLSLVEVCKSSDPPYKHLKSRNYRINVFVVDKRPVYDADGSKDLKLFIVSTTNSVEIKRGWKSPCVSCMEDFE